MMRLTDAIERRRQAEELRERAIDLLRRAEALDQLVPVHPEGTTGTCCNEAGPACNELISFAAGHARSRQRRENYFPQEIFGEPGWDIMLDLFIHDQDGRGVSVTNASLAGNTPPTTGLRWLKSLEDRGLVIREQSRQDRRVTWVRLTSRAQTLMREYLLGNFPGNCS